MQSELDCFYFSMCSQLLSLPHLLVLSFLVNLHLSVSLVFNLNVDLGVTGLG